MAALPGAKNITFVAGDTYTLPIQLFTGIDPDTGDPSDPLDLTGASVKAQIRLNPASNTVLAEFVILNAEDLTTDGVIILRLESNQTQPLAATPNSVWDLQVTLANGVRRTRLAGIVSVVADVTRD